MFVLWKSRPVTPGGRGFEPRLPRALTIKVWPPEVHAANSPICGTDMILLGITNQILGLVRFADWRSCLMLPNCSLHLQPSGNGVRTVCGDCLEDASFRAGQIGYDEIQQGTSKLDRNGLRFANVRDRNAIRRGVFDQSSRFNALRGLAPFSDVLRLHPPKPARPSGGRPSDSESSDRQQLALFADFIGPKFGPKHRDTRRNQAVQHVTELQRKSNKNLQNDEAALSL